MVQFCTGFSNGHCQQWGDWAEAPKTPSFPWWTMFTRTPPQNKKLLCCVGFRLPQGTFRKDDFGNQYNFLKWNWDLGMFSIVEWNELLRGWVQFSLAHSHSVHNRAPFLPAHYFFFFFSELCSLFQVFLSAAVSVKNNWFSGSILEKRHKEKKNGTFLHSASKRLVPNFTPKSHTSSTQSTRMQFCIIIVHSKHFWNHDYCKMSASVLSNQVDDWVLHLLLISVYITDRRGGWHDVW